MTTFLFAVRLVLAAVFAVAGVAKLRDHAGSQRAMRDFGVPAVLAAPLGVLLPLAEIAIAALLLPAATAWVGALGALVLLVAFIAGIALNLAQGRTPDCHCFGQLHSAPAGWPTLARNGVLAALAALVVMPGSDSAQLSAVAWIGTVSVAQVAALGGGLLLALTLAEGWFLFQLLRQHGRLLLKLDALEAQIANREPQPVAAEPQHGLPVGSSAPTFRLPDLDGQQVALDQLHASTRPVVLIFSDPGCGPCNTLLPDIARWQRDHADTLTVVNISRGSTEINRAKSSEHGLINVLLQHDREVVDAYNVPGTPSALVVQPNGQIGSKLAMGVEDIRALVAEVITVLQPQAPSGCQCGKHKSPSDAPRQFGQLAPAFALPDLDGRTVTRATLKGRPALLLFWNPHCGFCQRMLHSLRDWEASAPADAPRLVLVSNGDAAANQALQLRATVLLDPAFTLGQALGADGTPSAVLLDEAGRVASGVAVGAEAIFALASAADQVVAVA